MAVASIGPIHIGKYLSPCVSFSRTMGWFVGISTRTPTTSICLTAAPSSRAPDALPHWTLLKGTPFVNVHPLSGRSRRGPTASCPAARRRRAGHGWHHALTPPNPRPRRIAPGLSDWLSGLPAVAPPAAPTPPARPPAAAAAGPASGPGSPGQADAGEPASASPAPLRAPRRPRVTAPDS